MTSKIINTKVERLVAMMRDPNRAFRIGKTYYPHDIKGIDYQRRQTPGWFHLALVPYVGKTTLRALTAHPDVEYDRKLHAWRLDVDLGDLWIE